MPEYKNKPEPDSTKRQWQLGTNNQGDTMQIIEYNNTRDVVVRFLDDNYHTIRTQYVNFLTGCLRNPYHATIGEHGYLGEGPYQSEHRINGKRIYDPVYSIWSSMHMRAGNHDGTHPAYEDVEVDREWWNYQNFAKWYYDNLYNVDDEIMCVDKDILYKGNRIYSPETCIIIPNRINELFKKAIYEIAENGICRRTDSKIEVYKIRYLEKDSDGNYKYKSKSIRDKKEAIEFYKEKKLELIYSVADDYKDKIPDKVYKALKSFEF